MTDCDMIYENTLRVQYVEGNIMNRCKWCLCNEKMMRYHDEEWGVPLWDDQKQFEFLMMEVMQCGLNWNMMIQKREIFRQCFEEFDFDKVAEYGEEDIERILNTEGMIHSRRKIEAVIHNARCFQEIRKEWGSFSKYIWSFTKGKTYLYTGHQKGEIPARNGLSDRVSSDLKKRGMKYMGSVTVYSHLQACGIINDHLDTCFRFPELMELSDAVKKRREKEQ
nr:DNA-3-methyladenine glycosylase I [Blautia sp. An81]